MPYYISFKNRFAVKNESYINIKLNTHIHEKGFVIPGGYTYSLNKY